MTSGAKIIAIIPAYNEEKNIGNVIADLRRHAPAVDILVVNDASRDLTAQEALRCGASVVSLPYNLGIGGAVQTGFMYARERGYDIAVQFDGDGQHDAQHLAAIIEPVVSGRLDMCVGSRFLSVEGEFKSSFLRRVGIRFFSALIGALTGQTMTDPTSGFRAFGRRAIELFAREYPVDFPEPESIVIAKHQGARLGEAAVIMHPRLAGSSSIRYLRSGYYMVKVTLAIILCRMKRRR
ncbi:MAG: glycosyltransferase family 2 protein [Candidatus Omnitrophota bacterium]